eukprot:scaffold3072_cov125-Ochromonas_danica.AAC.2
MLDLIVDGIKLLQTIYTLRKQLNDNQEACLLLCDRVRIFDSWLQEWAGKDRYPDNASLEMSIQSLLTLLTEIGEFVRKFTKRGGSVWGQAKRLGKKVLFRKTAAESLNDFHQRIDQCASLLNISLLTMSAEDKRLEEMAALRNELNAQSEDLIEELRELKSDPGKLKELLEGLSEEVGEGNVDILREIKSLQQKVESQDSLSLRDLGGLEESLKASNEVLAAKMDKHYEEVVGVKEEVMGVRQKGEVLLEKANEVNVMMKKKVSEVTSLYSPMKQEEEAASSPSSSKESASVKRELSSLSHDEAIELLVVLGCSVDLKELCKNSFESPEEVNGRYLNGVTKVEHLREIGDNKSRAPMLNNVLDDLQRIMKEGVPVDLMQGIIMTIRRKLLLQTVHSSLKQMVESGEVSAFQELEALGSIAKIPAEDINRGFTANLSDEEWGKGLEGVTALHISAVKGDAEIVRLLLLHPEIAVNTVDSKFGFTPLILACLTGHVVVVKILLADSRVDVYKEAKNANTSLHLACSGGHVEVVKILLEDSRVDVNKKNKDGDSPLHYACKYGREEVVKILLADSRVDINKEAK